ncbi:unnamed protein product [Parajaminaea phylloscopi]
MPRPGLSYEHKVTLMRHVDDGVCELKDLPGMAPIALSTARTLRRTWLDNKGSLPLPKHGHLKGRPREVPQTVVDAIEAIVEADPAVYLDEIKSDLADMDMDHFHLTTYHRVLKRLDLRRKMATQIAEKQSPAQREAYMCRIGQYTADQLVFVDESGFDLRVTNRRIVRGRKGQRVRYSTIFGNRGKHHTLLPACSLSKPLFAIYITEDGVDGYDFFEWVSQMVIPEMNEFPGQRSVLVANNASIHKFPELREMVEDAAITAPVALVAVTWQVAATAPVSTPAGVAKCAAETRYQVMLTSAAATSQFTSQWSRMQARVPPTL